MSRNLVRRSAAHAAVLALLCAPLALLSTDAHARGAALTAWTQRYGAISASADNADCQLCHTGARGSVDAEWNGYGWDVRDALRDDACDLDGSGQLSFDEAFFCVETLNSDNDGSGYTNLDEILLNTQPGWTNGPFNTFYTIAGETTGNLPPDDIGQLDPDGTEPPPPVEPPPPGEDDDVPPGQLVRGTIVVNPGDSIQAAIDRAAPGARIYVKGGVYREVSNPVNAINITKHGITLEGQTNSQKRVIIENAGNQRNGIAIVAPEHTDCMSCHSDLAPPFPLEEWVPTGTTSMEPMLYDIEVRGITIRNFENNGIFTNRVDGFKFIDVESIDNPNYGIFPVLSKNGLIENSYARGARDSGIWVETSENVIVRKNVVEDNTNGLEISNSDDVEIVDNVAFNNTVGIANLLLPDIYDDRDSAKRVNLRNNHLFDNNRANNATPGSVLAEVPAGIAILHLGVDESEISGNLIENNDFAGVVIADYCLTVLPTPFSCLNDPNVIENPEFLLDNTSVDNRVLDNTLIDNGTNADPGSMFAPFAADITLLTAGDLGNCYEGNLYDTFVSTLGVLPPCP